MEPESRRPPRIIPAFFVRFLDSNGVSSRPFRLFFVFFFSCIGFFLLCVLVSVVLGNYAPAFGSSCLAISGCLTAGVLFRWYLWSAVKVVWRALPAFGNSVSCGIGLLGKFGLKCFGSTSRFVLRLIAAFLSLVLPGLGQIMLGKTVLGLLLFIASAVLWVFSLGWIVHLIACSECFSGNDVFAEDFGRDEGPTSSGGDSDTERHLFERSQHLLDLEREIVGMDNPTKREIGLSQNPPTHDSPS